VEEGSGGRSVIVDEEAMREEKGRLAHPLAMFCLVRKVA
jgi:hypothetical protein